MPAVRFVRLQRHQRYAISSQAETIDLAHRSRHSEEVSERFIGVDFLSLRRFSDSFGEQNSIPGFKELTMAALPQNICEIQKPQSSEMLLARSNIANCTAGRTLIASVG
jgi:hypothetical protein